MPHKVTFESPKIALVGKTQPVIGTETSPDYTNVILATNLSVAEVITSDSAPLATDNLHRDSVVSITDRYITASFDSMIPKLGSFYARRYPANELVNMMFDSKIPANAGMLISQVGSPYILSFITKIETRPQELVNEFLMYVTSGFTNFDLPHATFSGELPLDFGVQQLAGDFADKAGLLFFAKTEKTNVSDLIFSPSPAAGVASALPYITTKVFDGDAYIGSQLPIAPYFESSNLYQMIYMAYGITGELEAAQEDALHYICEALTYVKSAKSQLTQSKKWLEELSKLVVMDAASKANIDRIIADIDKVLVYYTNYINALEFAKGDLKMLTLDYLVNFQTQDLDKMIADLARDMTWAAGLTRDNILQTSGVTVVPTTALSWLTTFKGTFAPSDSVTVNGLTVTNDGLTTLTAIDVVNVLVSGVTTGDLTVTGSYSPPPPTPSNAVANTLELTFATPQPEPTITVSIAPASTFGYTTAINPTSVLSDKWQLFFAGYGNLTVSANSWVEICGVLATATADVTVGDLLNAAYNLLSRNGVATINVTAAVIDNGVYANWGTNGKTVDPTNKWASINLVSNVGAVSYVPYGEGLQYISTASPYAVSKESVVNIYGNYTGATTGSSTWWLKGKSNTATEKSQSQAELILNNTVSTYPVGTTFTYSGATLRVINNPATINELMNAINKFWAGQALAVTNIEEVTAWTSSTVSSIKCVICTGFSPSGLSNSVIKLLVWGKDLSYPNDLHLVIANSTTSGQNGSKSFSVPLAGDTSPTDFIIKGTERVLNVGDSFVFNGQTVTISLQAQLANVLALIIGNPTATSFSISGNTAFTLSNTKALSLSSISPNNTLGLNSTDYSSIIFKSPTGQLPQCTLSEISYIRLKTLDLDTASGNVRFTSNLNPLTLIPLGTVFTVAGITFTTTASMSIVDIFTDIALAINSMSTSGTNLSTGGSLINNYVANALYSIGSPYLIIQKNSDTEKSFEQTPSSWAANDPTRAFTFAGSGFSGNLVAIETGNASLQRTALQTKFSVNIGGVLEANQQLTLFFDGESATALDSFDLFPTNVIDDLIASYAGSGFVLTKNGATNLLIEKSDGTQFSSPTFGTSSATVSVYSVPNGALPIDFLPISQPSWSFDINPTQADIEAGSTVTIPAFGLSFTTSSPIAAANVATLIVQLGSGGTVPSYITLNTPSIPLATWVLKSIFKFKVAYGGTSVIGNVNIVVTDVTGTMTANIAPQSSYLVPYWSNAPWYLDFAGTWEKDDSVAFGGKKYTVLRRLSSQQLANQIYLYSIAVSLYDATAISIQADNATIADIDRKIVDLAPLTTGRARLVLMQDGLTLGSPSPQDLSEGKVIVVKQLTNPSEVWAGFGSNLNDQFTAQTDNTNVKNDVNSLAPTDPKLKETFLEYKMKAQGYLIDSIKSFNAAISITDGKDESGATSSPVKYNLTDILKNMLNMIVNKRPSGTGMVTKSPLPTYPTGYIEGMVRTDLELCLEKLVFTNETSSPDMMTLEARRSSVQLVGQQKTKIGIDMRALIDVTLEMGKRPMTTFSYEGNLVDTRQKAEMPLDVKKQIYQIGDVINASSVRNASLSEQCGTNPVIGCNCESNYNNICLVRASMPNFAGFSRSRALTTCGNMWAYSSVPWEMTLEIIQEKADTSNPDSFNVEDSLGKSFNFVYTQNGSAGETIEIQVSGAVLKNFADGDTQGLLTHSLTFEVTGFSRIILK